MGSLCNMSFAARTNRERLTLLVGGAGLLRGAGGGGAGLLGGGVVGVGAGLGLLLRGAGEDAEGEGDVAGGGGGGAGVDPFVGRMRMSAGSSSGSFRGRINTHSVHQQCVVQDALRTQLRTQH